jgi:hypothetical protein
MVGAWGVGSTSPSVRETAGSLRHLSRQARDFQTERKLNKKRRAHVYAGTPKGLRAYPMTHEPLWGMADPGVRKANGEFNLSTCLNHLSTHDHFTKRGSGQSYMR